MKKTKSSFINLGFSTILMVFLTICFVTFASLSVLTAHSDYKLSKKVAQKTTTYYQADAVARNMTKHIDSILYSQYLNSASMTHFFDAVATTDFAQDAPVSIADISVSVTDDISSISYTVPVTATQNLYVTLKINYPTAGSECFTTITRWQTLTSYELDTSDSYFDLYTGDES